MTEQQIFFAICAAIFLGLAGAFAFEEWQRHRPSAWRKHFAAGLLWTSTRRKETR